MNEHFLGTDIFGFWANADVTTRVANTVVINKIRVD